MKANRNYNITELKQAEVALRESEENMRYIVKHDPNAIAVYDCKLHYIAVSERYLHDYGVKEEDIIGKHHYEVFPEMPQKWKDVHQRCLAGAIESNDDDYFERPDGSITYNRWECRPWRKIDGEIGGIITYTEVTTERKKAEKALINSETRYRRLFESSKDGILILDAETGMITDVNPFLIELLGYSKEQFIGKTIWEIGFFRDIADNKEKFSELQQKEYVRYEDLPLETADRRQINVEFVSNVYLVNKKKVIQCNIRDITERKRAEVIIQQEKDFSEAILNSLPGLFYLFDDQGKFLRWNKNFEYFSGYTAEEITHISPFDLFADVDKVKMALSIQEVFQDGKAMAEDNFLSKDKTKTPFLFTGNRFHFENKQCLVGMAIDITERKRTEAKLLESEERFRSLYENSTIGIYRTTPEGIIILANPTLVKMLGYSSFKELTSRNLEKDGFEPNYERKQFLERIEMNGEIIGLEAAWTRKDGVIIYINESAKAIRDSNGKTLYFDGTVEDITERKHTEKELIEAKNKAEESDRLKSSFLANMSHEVRTPLNSIIGFSELLANADFGEDQKNEFIQLIITSGNNLLNIISDIMDISKIESGEITIRKSQINVQNFFSGIKEQFSLQAKANKLEFKVTIPDTDEETVIFADAGRLRQIFNNLMSNAIKFTANGSIEIGYQPKGKMVEFYIKDTGIGIPAEHHDTIFERFRQVEDAKTRTYGGNGLGLAISKNLVELMGGEIWLESESGKGSVFYFTIPYGS